VSKPNLLLLGAARPRVVQGLEPHFLVHPLAELDEAALATLAAKVEAMAITHASPTVRQRVDGQFLARFARLRIVASFGVGYDHVDAAWAAEHGIIVTNTPDVLNEEVADTALGLLLCTVRELPQAMAYLKAGHWTDRPYPLTVATLRNRKVGLVGMGRIGQAIARRLEAFGVPVVYHARHAHPEVAYVHFPDLVQMASMVDTLVVIVPGGPATHHLINAKVLAALGPSGILINVARGSVVDETALIEALTAKRLLAAGLDVYADEPHVPESLLRLANVVLLPHVGSASLHTRGLMDQLVVDNLLAWVEGRPPLTPVAETRAMAAR
jgi:lactate dehydrogenase-like 2-hydroxyacid dehydrogenase